MIDSIATERLDSELAKELKKHDKRDYKSLIDQVENEYMFSWWFMKPKFDAWALRLKLYNNQKRDAESVGDPLLFTIHQTVLSSLYGDRLSVEFLGRESGDEEVADNLNSLAEFDYADMEKPEIDYAWDWDASFFGRGLLLMSEFDRKLKLPIPEVIDMMTWLRDPRATSVNGDRKGRGAMRFGGREIGLTKREIEEAGVYFNYEHLKDGSGSSGSRSLLDKSIQARALAQGFNNPKNKRELQYQNKDYRLLEWFTIWQGKRVIVTLAEDRKKIIRYTELKDQTKFPIIDRSIYPIAHDWDGVSIPDLVEDKQRGRSVVQNLALRGIKLGLEPTYLYDTNKIKNRADLNVEFNKHIPVDGNPTGAIQEVERHQVKQEAQWILDVLNTASERATASPDIQQGMRPKDNRTATETNVISNKVDTRYSLSAKIFGWSEKKFWRQWYKLYKDYFKAGIDEKIIRITGAMGSKWRPLSRENIIANIDPDIKIESRVISENRRFNDLQKYRLFLKDVLAVDPQNSNIRFALRRIGRLSGFRKEEVEQILPPTIDEMRAEKENDQLNAGQAVMVQVFDDDFVHIEIHNKAEDSPEKEAHINAHKEAMMLKRVRPEFNVSSQNRPQTPTEVKPEGVSFANQTPSTTGGQIPTSQ